MQSQQIVGYLKTITLGHQGTYIWFYLMYSTKASLQCEKLSTACEQLNLITHDSITTTIFICFYEF